MDDLTQAPPPTATGTGVPPVAASAGLLLGAAAAAWWGADTATARQWRADGLEGTPADYAITPLPLPGWAETAIGVAGLVVAVVCAVLLVRAARAGRLSRPGVLAVVLLLPVSVTAGLWWAVATAPTIGANIGLGLMTFVAAPLSALFATGAVICGAVAVKRRRAH